ncbi:PEP-CTERM sorting domain-containing protein [Paraglaciecola chathamensis]|nr:PEP-CTERM sorting domain-containing protein [Paraglaciecola chathamensis]
MSIRKFGAAVALVVASLGFTSFSANAVLITQSIEFVDDPFYGSLTLGEITVDLDSRDIGTGFVSILDFVSLDLFDSTEFDVFEFEAIVDASSLSAVNSGIELLSFDVTELDSPDMWSYQVFIDIFAPENNNIVIFDANLELIYFSDAITLGEARVPAPAGIAILALGLVAMGLRRRKN